MVRMSLSKLTIIGLCAHGAVTAALVILSAASGAGLPFYLLAAAYGLTGLFFLELIYTRVLAPASRSAALLDRMARTSGTPASAASTRAPDLEEIASRLDTQCASAEATRMELDSLIRSLPVAILDIDMDGRITFANEAALALTGYLPSDMNGRPFTSLIPKEELDNAGMLLQKALSGGKINGNECRMLCKDGSAREVEFSAAPILEGGRVAGCRCVALDMNRSKALEAALQEARSNSEEAVARLDKAERDLEQFAVIAIRREVKMREIRERLSRHNNDFKRR